jgi:hypothetical protein
MLQTLRAGGRIAFATITLTPGLAGARLRRAIEAGPSAVDGPDVGDLLRDVGYVDVETHDVTDDYLATAQRWVDARVRHHDDLRPLDPATYDERVGRGRGAVAAISDGLLQRFVVSARRPAASSAR